MMWVMVEAAAAATVLVAMRSPHVVGLVVTVGPNMAVHVMHTAVS
jgi:hypothetical protein